MRTTDNRIILSSIVVLAGIAITVLTVWRPWRHVRTVASATTTLLTLVTLVMIVGNAIVLAHEPTREISCLDRLDAAATWSYGEYFGQRSGGPVRYSSYT